MSNKKHTVDVINHIEKVQLRCKSHHISKIRVPLTSSKGVNKMISLPAAANPTMKQNNSQPPRASMHRTNLAVSRYSQAITADIRAREDILEVRDSIKQQRVKQTLKASRGVALKNHIASTKKLNRGDQKIMEAIAKKSLDETAENISWAIVGKNILQAPQDITIWESKQAFPPPLRQLPKLWDILGKEKVEREAAYRSINEELVPKIRKMTSQAYEMALGLGGEGRLPPEDRLKLNGQIARTTKSAYKAYVSREEGEVSDIQNEILKLKRSIAKKRSESRKLKESPSTSLPQNDKRNDQVDRNIREPVKDTEASNITPLDWNATSSSNKGSKSLLEVLDDLMKDLATYQT